MTNIYLAGHGTNIKINKDLHGWYADVSFNFGKEMCRTPYSSDEGTTVSIARSIVQAKIAGRPFDLYLGSDGHYTDETCSEFYLINGQVVEDSWGSRHTINDVESLVTKLEANNARMIPIAEKLMADHGSNIDLLRCQATDRLLINLRAMIDAGMIMTVS